jgi:exopolysaccharide biosynthesis polyprenyl glycosylphosphotransferase
MANNGFRKSFIIVDLLASGTVWSAFFIYRKICIETVKFGVDVPFHADIKFFAGLFLVPVFWFLIYYSAGTYIDVRRKQPGKLLFNLLTSTFIGAFALFFILILDDTVVSYRNYYQSFWFLFGSQFFLVFLGRFIVLYFKNQRFKRNKDHFKVLILGKSEAITTFSNKNCEWFKRNHFEVAGYISEDDDLKKFLSSADNSEKVIEDLKIEEVFVLTDASEKEKLEMTLLKLYSKDIYIRIQPELYGNVNIPAKSIDIFDDPLLLLSKDILHTWQQSVKTFLDITMSVGAIIILLPLIILLLIAIKATSKGPVLYSHERIGKNGKPFKILKFRSMYLNSEPEGPQLASRSDQRITTIGKFMRRRRLDEIPNFINVFKGDMSLVGPRPERKFYIEQILEKAPQYSKLHLVKPGITSWGQVYFGYAENIDEMIQRMRYDLVYIENMSLFADFRILAKTIGIIVKGQGV